MHKDIEKLREQMDEIDKQLKKYLGKRGKLVKKIGKFKKKNSLPIEDKKREKKIVANIKNPFTKKVFKEIIKISKEIQV